MNTLFNGLAPPPLHYAHPWLLTPHRASHKLLHLVLPQYNPLKPGKHKTDADELVATKADCGVGSCQQHLGPKPWHTKPTLDTRRQSSKSVLCLCKKKCLSVPAGGSSLCLLLKAGNRKSYRDTKHKQRCLKKQLRISLTTDGFVIFQKCLTHCKWHWQCQLLVFCLWKRKRRSGRKKYIESAINIFFSSFFLSFPNLCCLLALSLPFFFSRALVRQLNSQSGWSDGPTDRRAPTLIQHVESAEKKSRQGLVCSGLKTTLYIYIYIFITYNFLFLISFTIIMLNTSLYVDTNSSTIF